MVANFLSTCFSCGRLIGLLKNSSIPLSMHSLTLLSSLKAVSATIGALYPIFRMSLVDCNPSRFGIWISMKITSNRSLFCIVALTRSYASCPSLAIVTS